MSFPENHTNGEATPPTEPVPDSLDALLTPEPEPEPPTHEEPAEEEAPPVEASAEHEEPPPEAPVALAAEEPPHPDSKNWYIVKVQSNREDSIKDAIERRVKIEGLEEFFDQILIPVEKVSELRNGKRVVRTRKMYPGYIMAHVEFNDRVLYLFRETPGVGDFVGATQNRPPQPMPAREVEVMLRKQQAPGAGAEQVIDKVKVPFDKGDKVRVRDGTFAGMEGEVKEIRNPKIRRKLREFASS